MPRYSYVDHHSKHWLNSPMFLRVSCVLTTTLILPCIISSCLANSASPSAPLPRRPPLRATRCNGKGLERSLPSPPTLAWISPHTIVHHTLRASTCLALPQPLQCVVVHRPSFHEPRREETPGFVVVGIRRRRRRTSKPRRTRARWKDAGSPIG